MLLVFISLKALINYCNYCSELSKIRRTTDDGTKIHQCSDDLQVTYRHAVMCNGLAMSRRLPNLSAVAQCIFVVKATKNQFCTYFVTP